MCIFKALHKNRKKQQHDLGLSLEEFMHFYDILGFSWTQVGWDLTFICVVYFYIYFGDQGFKMN